MDENNVNALDALLDGNTTNTSTNEDTSTNTSVEGADSGQDIPPTIVDDTPNNDTDDSTEGGDPNLESSGESASKDEGVQQKAQNAAFAQMRVQLAKRDKTLINLAKALGLDESDPNKLSDSLINMAQERLANQNNVPVELYKELEATREQVQQLQSIQNENTAAEKLIQLKDVYGISQEELVAFAEQLDKEGVILSTNPNIDVEYEYYKRNRAKIEEAKIQAAVEEALKNSANSDNSSSTPSNLQSNSPTDETQINNVSALNDFLNKK